MTNADERFQLVIVGPSPFTVAVREGWMARIASVDGIFTGIRRLYVNPLRAAGRGPLRYLSPEVAEISLALDDKDNLFTLENFVVNSNLVYVHTTHLARFMLPWLSSGKVVVDIHGAAPEEEVMQGNLLEARALGQAEEAMLSNARAVVVVSEAMSLHFGQKYPDLNPVKLVLPALGDSWVDDPRRKRRKSELPVKVIYSGGIQPWQNLDDMLMLARDTQAFAAFTFLSDESRRIELRAQSVARCSVQCLTVAREHLAAAYQLGDFGLLLRDESPVNRVSTPTKLFEYLTHGLIPIVRFPHIGDYVANNYLYVTEENFRVGDLPDSATRSWMAAQNRDVVRRLRQTFDATADELRELALPATTGGQAASNCSAGTEYRFEQATDERSVESPAPRIGPLRRRMKLDRQHRVGLLHKSQQSVAMRRAPGDGAFSSFADFRSRLVLTRDVVGSRCLEIGPFLEPTFRAGQFDVQTADVYSTLALQEQASAIGRDPREVVPVDFVYDGTNISQIPSGRFDVIVAAHVLEHVLFFIDYLQQVRSLLHEDGLLLVVLPDKRFSFDRYRPDTPLSHLLHEFISPGDGGAGLHALETQIYYDSNYVSGTNDPQERLSHEALELSLQEWHPGVHAHVFQAPTVIESIIAPLIGMGLLPYRLEDAQFSRQFGEFAILLRGSSLQPDWSLVDSVYRLARDTVADDLRRGSVMGVQPS